MAFPVSSGMAKDRRVYKGTGTGTWEQGPGPLINGRTNKIGETEFEKKGESRLYSMFFAHFATTVHPHTASLSAYTSPAIRAELSCTPGTAKTPGLRPRVI